MGQINPYQPPRSQVADVGAAADFGSYVENGRAVEAGQGWTWIASAYGLFKKRAGAWVAITVIGGVIFVVASMLPVVGWLINTLLMPVFVGGLVLGCRALEEDGDFGTGQLFAGFSYRTGRLLTIGAISIAAWAVIMIPFFLFMGSSLFALMKGDPAALAALGPMLAVGILAMLGLSVPLYMALWFAPCLVVFHEVEPVPALAQSFRACLKNVMPFLVYGVIVMVLTMLASIPLGLGFLILIPVVIASVYTAYRDIYFAPR